MSMIGNLVSVSPQKLEELLQAPEQVPEFLGEVYEREDRNEHIDIDKTWQLIHFLLTGEQYEGEFPLSAVILGGAELGEEDVGYGPARYLTPDEVRAVAAAIAPISEEQLWSRFDAKAALMAKIYPEIWSGDESEYVQRDYVLGNYSEVRRFYFEAAKAGHAVLAFIN